MIQTSLRRLQFPRITLLGSVLTKFNPQSVGYAYSNGPYNDLANSYSYGYAGQSEACKPQLTSQA